MHHQAIIWSSDFFYYLILQCKSPSACSRTVTCKRQIISNYCLLPSFPSYDGNNTKTGLLICSFFFFFPLQTSRTMVRIEPFWRSVHLLPGKSGSVSEDLFLTFCLCGSECFRLFSPSVDGRRTAEHPSSILGCFWQKCIVDSSKQCNCWISITIRTAIFINFP